MNPSPTTAAKYHKCQSCKDYILDHHHSQFNIREKKLKPFSFVKSKKRKAKAKHRRNSKESGPNGMSVIMAIQNNRMLF